MNAGLWADRRRVLCIQRGTTFPLLHLLRERAMSDTYKIKVVKADTGEVVKTLEAVTERAAIDAARKQGGA